MSNYSFCLLLALALFTNSASANGFHGDLPSFSELPAFSEPPLTRNLVSNEENRELNEVMNNSERKIQQRKLQTIMNLVRRGDHGRVLSVKRNNQGYAVRVLKNGRIRNLQVNQAGTDISR